MSYSKVPISFGNVLATSEKLGRWLHTSGSPITKIYFLARVRATLTRLGLLAAHCAPPYSPILQPSTKITVSFSLPCKVCTAPILCLAQWLTFSGVILTTGCCIAGRSVSLSNSINAVLTALKGVIT